jgi:hypothetical protein
MRIINQPWTVQTERQFVPSALYPDEFIDLLTERSA